MRVENSIRNIYISMLTQVVIVLLGFISRKVFIDNLGTEYLGVNGLLTSLLSMLSLVEGGIGSSIIYNLYKPLADNDKVKVTALIQLYRKLYGIIAILIFILSTIMYIFLGAFIEGGTTIPYIGVVYFIFVLKNLISYLNAHKWSLINADQKGYVIAKYNLIFNIITTVIKIIVLQVTQNYILFLIFDVVIFAIQNIYNGKIVNTRYSYIRTKQKYAIDESTRANLITNVKAIFIHNVGAYSVFGTDNLLISTLINVTTVGIYSNYTMIIKQLEALLIPILNGIGASVGNLIAIGDNDKIYKTFKVVYLINFWIFSLSVIFLFNLLEPFIDWWLGKGLLLDKFTFIVILINFYISGLRASVSLFKSKAGIFDKDKYIPLIESAINLGTSIILAQHFGLVGIFMGTTISSILMPVWTQAKIVYNHLFEKSVFEYFKTYILYVVVTLSTGIITTYICNKIIMSNVFMVLVVKGILCVTLPNLIFIIIFYKTEEFKYLLSLINPTIYRLKCKLIIKNFG